MAYNRIDSLINGEGETKGDLAVTENSLLDGCLAQSITNTIVGLLVQSYSSFATVIGPS